MADAPSGGGSPIFGEDVQRQGRRHPGQELAELIQDACTPDAVAHETVDLLTNAERVMEMKEQLALVREKLGAPGASQRAAAAILEVGSTKTRKHHENGKVTKRFAAGKS